MARAVDVTCQFIFGIKVPKQFRTAASSCPSSCSCCCSSTHAGATSSSCGQRKHQDITCGRLIFGITVPKQFRTAAFSSAFSAAASSAFNAAIFWALVSTSGGIWILARNDNLQVNRVRFPYVLVSIDKKDFHQPLVQWLVFRDPSGQLTGSKPVLDSILGFLT